MNLDDDDAFELSRRRLEEEVKKSVETGLFRYYRNLGSIILAVLGAVGIGIGWPALLDRIDTQIAEQVEEPVAAATEAAAKASDMADRILRGLAERQEALNESVGRLGTKFDDMHVRYGEASAQIEKVEGHVGELRQLTEFFKTRVQTDPVSREDLRQLEERLAEVVSQTSVLAEAIGKLSAEAPAEDVVVEDAKRRLSSLYQAQTAAVVQAERMAANPRERAVVYVQFAGGKRADIQGLSKLLRQAGWTVPGEERIGTAAGKREVRYFHDGDAKAAELLAQEVERGLLELGLPRQEVSARKVKVGILPADGILELWLEIPAR